MADYVTYEIKDSAGRTYYVTTDMMDTDKMWYRGNSNLSLSVDGTQYTSRQSLVANSRLISNPATGGGSTTYTTITSVKAVGTTAGVQTAWYTYAVFATVIVLIVLMLIRKKSGGKSWRSY